MLVEKHKDTTCVPGHSVGNVESTMIINPRSDSFLMRNVCTRAVPLKCSTVYRHRYTNLPSCWQNQHLLLQPAFLELGSPCQWHIWSSRFHPGSCPVDFWALQFLLRMLLAQELPSAANKVIRFQGWVVAHFHIALRGSSQKKQKSVTNSKFPSGPLALWFNLDRDKTFSHSSDRNRLRHQIPSKDFVLISSTAKRIFLPPFISFLSYHQYWKLNVTEVIANTWRNNLN